MSKDFKEARELACRYLGEDHSGKREQPVHRLGGGSMSGRVQIQLGDRCGQCSVNKEVVGNAGGVRSQEIPEASVGTIVFTLSDTGNLGKVSTYVVTGSLGLLSEVCRGQGQRQRISQEATAVIQASSNSSNGKGAVMGFVCLTKQAR